VIRRVSLLIYEFEFPNNMNIYSIISITHLKSVSKGSDSYNRSRNDYSVLVEKDSWNNIEEEWRKFEIEKFTDRR
jgi:hypothetical protein